MFEDDIGIKPGKQEKSIVEQENQGKTILPAKQAEKQGTLKSKAEQLGNEQVYDMLTNNELSWQSILYDLINTEQLDPMDIDLGYIANKYLEKIRKLEEANFFISSKVLLAASLLLRIKSEILLEKYIRSLDDILFGKKEQAKPLERIELDEEIPSLFMRTPIPRQRKVSLQELMTALNKAIKTESRRIEKTISEKQAERETGIVFPRTRINIRDRIRKIYSRILTMFKHKQTKLSYSELVGNNREEKIISFLPVLHLDTQQKVWLEQEKHFDEIYVWLYSHYRKEKAEKFAAELLEAEKEEIDEIKKEEELEKVTGFDKIFGDDLVEGAVEEELE